jgi:hypothetical protein
MKVYVVGCQTGYSRWIDNLELVNTIEESEVVLFTGGSDIGSNLYGEKENSCTYTSPHRDIEEVTAYYSALELKKICWGTCRGLQLMGALNGAKLIQDMSHPSQHRIYFKDGSYCNSNSIHHQMVYPFNLKEGVDYHLLAWAKELSHYYSNVNHNDMNIKCLDGEQLKKEPEFIYFPKTKSIGFQGHPEMLPTESKMVRIANSFLSLLVENRLDDVLMENATIDSILETYEIEKSIKKQTKLKIGYV